MDSIKKEMDAILFSDDDLDENKYDKLSEELKIFENPDKLEDIYLKKVDDVNDNSSDFYASMGVEYLKWLIPGVVDIIKTTPNQGREALIILDHYLNALKNNGEFDAISNIYGEAVKRIQVIDPFFDPPKEGPEEGMKSRKKTRRSQRKGKTQKKSRRSQRSRRQSRRRRSSKK